MIVGVEREPPYFGTGDLTVCSEEDGIIFGEHHDGRLVEEYVAVLVAQRTNAHHVVMEFRHDVDGGVWE